MRSILYSFLIPKFYSFYLIEIKIILNLLSSIFLSIFSNKIFINIKLYSSLKRYLIVTSILYSLMLFIILFHFLGSSNPNFFELIFVFKMVIYFLLLPIFIDEKLAIQFLSNIKIITIIFFLSSLIIFLFSLSSSSISSLLWQAEIFGARFVGFTGSSISHLGFDLIGSTANAVGILYVFLFSIFALGDEGLKDYRIALICFIGISLTLSQSAILTFLILLFLSISPRFKIPIKSFLYFVAFLSILFIYIYLYMEDSIFFRIFENIRIIINDGVLPNTIYDRYIQWMTVGTYISNCPMSIIAGQLIIDNQLCGETFISESYFLDVFKKYGFLTLIFSFIQFYCMYVLCNQSKLFVKSFFIAWFISNIFLNNTYQTDFILITMLLLWRGSLNKNLIMNK